MARSSTDIAADLAAARASLAVTFQEIHDGDKGMTTRSVTETLKAVAALEAELSMATATETGTRRIRFIRLSGNSGY